MAENNHISVAIDMEEEDMADVVGTTPIPSDDMCEVCCLYKPFVEFVQFSNCGHQFCLQCVRTAFEGGVMESRVNLQCLRCAESVAQHEIRQVLDPGHYEKYLNFTLRKFLVSQQPDACYCLAPNCPFACINSCPNVPSNYTDRNHFVCGRAECSAEYCNKCKRVWHPGSTCEEFEGGLVVSVGITDELKRSIGAKNCPSCGVTIEKTSDGSCNQVVCAVCQTSFCWLCGKQVSEMHYMSPTGCPLYGSKMWTKRKRWCCRVWLWILAPLLTLLLSLVVLPVVLIAFPLGVGYKVYKTSKDKCHKVCAVSMTVMAMVLCVLLAPLVAFLASLLVLPLMLLYFYCFIPVHTCVQSSS